MKNFVITISRMCGSGGSFIGKILARRLGVDYYDKNLLKLASDDSGISEELFAKADEKVKGSILFKVSKSVYNGELIPPQSDYFTSNRNLFNYQAKVLKELARNESFVVIGRCADFILRDMPDTDVIRVFVSANRDFCIKQEAAYLRTSDREAEARINKLDRDRRDYYRYYTGEDWNDPRNYDICLNTSTISYEQCADLIISALKKKQGE